MAESILAFVTARLAEDEAIARAVQDRSAPWDGQWEPDGADCLRTYNGWVLFYRSEIAPLPPGLVAHVARWDPARVQAEVALKRQMIDLLFEHEATVDGEWGCGHAAVEIRAGQCERIPVDGIKGLRVLAAAWQGHPKYRAGLAPQS